MSPSARPDKLSLIVFSGEFDRVHYALATASAALAIGMKVTLFFTMGACRALAKPKGDETLGWRDLRAGTGLSAGAFDDGLKARGIGHFEDLLAACVALGARFMVCEMGLKAIDMPAGELRPDVPIDQGGLVTFLTDASASGSMMFV
jgi:peroxiredoxin family protein